MTDADFPSLGETPIDTSDTCHIEINSAARPELTFQLSLPNGWAHDPDSTGSIGEGSVWTPLAVFGEKPEDAGEVAPRDWAVVTVLWRKLEFEVPMDEWTAVELGQMQVTIDTMRLWDDGRGPVIDAGGTTVGTIDDPAGGEPTQIPAVVRAIVRSDGDNAFMVWCMATTGAYARASEAFRLAGATFELQQSTGADIETLLCATADAPAFGVAYPESWQFQPVQTPAEVTGKSAVDLLLIDQGLLKGYLRVTAIDLELVEPGPLDALLSDAMEEMEQAGVTPQANWSELADPVILSIPDLKAAYSTTGLLQDAAYELHFGIVLRGSLLFCVTALVLPIQAEALMCLRGHRAYAIALKTAEPAELEQDPGDSVV